MVGRPVGMVTGMVLPCFIIAAAVEEKVVVQKQRPWRWLNQPSRAKYSLKEWDSYVFSALSHSATLAVLGVAVNILNGTG